MIRSILIINVPITRWMKRTKSLFNCIFVKYCTKCNENVFNIWNSNLIHSVRTQFRFQLRITLHCEINELLLATFVKWQAVAISISARKEELIQHRIQKLFMKPKVKKRAKSLFSKYLKVNTMRNYKIWTWPMTSLNFCGNVSWEKLVAAFY